MSVAEKISVDLKDAMKSGDKIKVLVLRMVKSEIKNREIEKGGSISDEDVTAVFRSFAKKAKESIEQFSKGGRADLAEKEEKELAVIQDYLPDQLSEDKVKSLVKEAIDESGASSLKDMGKVMKLVMAKARGQADGKVVNGLVKEMLEA